MFFSGLKKSGENYVESKLSKSATSTQNRAAQQGLGTESYDLLFDVNLVLSDSQLHRDDDFLGLSIDALAGQSLFDALNGHPSKHDIVALFKLAEENGVAEKNVGDSVFKVKSINTAGNHFYSLHKEVLAAPQWSWKNERTTRLILDEEGNIEHSLQVAQNLDQLKTLFRAEDWMAPRLKQSFDAWNKQGTKQETGRFHERLDKSDWYFSFERIDEQYVQLEVKNIVANALSNSGFFFEELWTNWPDPVMLFDKSGSRIWNNELANTFTDKVSDLSSFFNHFKTDAFLSLGKLWKELTQEGIGQQFQVLADDKDEYIVQIDSVTELEAFVLFLKPAGNLSGANDLKVQSIAHDLRSPLANLKNLLLLQDRTEDEEMRSKLLKKAQESAHSLQKLLHGMLDRQTGKEATNLRSLWELVINDLDYLIQEANPSIVAQIEVEETTARRSLIRSVLQNLLSNALKYRSEERPSKISLSIKSSEDYLTIRMEDNGQGMDLSKGTGLLFGGYRDLSSSRKEDSFGVGMSILKKKIEANMGTIKVNSQLNVGSIFLVKIPTEELTAQQISLF